MTSEPAFLGRGWAWPPSFGPGGADVAMVAGSDDVAQSLEIIFATDPGERVMREAFGAALTRFMFAEIDQTMLTSLRGAILDAIIAFEPRIQLDGVDIVESSDTPGLLTISLHYTLRGTNSRYNLVYPFYLREATAGALAGHR